MSIESNITSTMSSNITSSMGSNITLGDVSSASPLSQTYLTYVLPPYMITNLDHIYIVICGFMIFFMQAGFAFVEAGAVRSKNVTSLLIKNMFDGFVAGIAYWLCGFAFAYGKGNQFIGHAYFAAKDLPPTNYSSLFFQYTFAATSATVVSGALAERSDIIAYFVYSFFICGFVYPVVVHWNWGGGFLSTGWDYGGAIGRVGFRDFSGSGMVHMLGGASSFMGAAIIGPRIGRFHKETGAMMTIRGHSVPLVALGGFIVFFGFLAFNGGSQMSITKPGDIDAIGLSVENTVISGSFGAFSALLVNKSPLFGNRSWSLLVSINGAICGMVSICASCNMVYPWAAAIIGTVSGFVLPFWCWVLKKLQVDDPLDTTGVHFGGGSWGLMAVALFNKDDGILMYWNQKSALVFAWQLAGLVCITLWAGVLMGILFLILKKLNVFRVSAEVELKGFDIPKHHEPAYPVDAYGHGHIEKLLQIIDKSGPFNVTQVYERMQGQPNYAYAHVSDNGLYENPEVRSALRSVSSMASLSTHSLTGQELSIKTPHASKGIEVLRRSTSDADICEDTSLQFERPNGHSEPHLNTRDVRCNVIPGSPRIPTVA